MKKNVLVSFIIIITIIIFMPSKTGFAQNSASQTATPSETRDQQITELKQKIATKVAELKILSPQAIAGTIKTLSDQKIILNSNNNDIDVEIGSDTALSRVDQNNNSKTLKIGDLNTGDNLIAWGNFNKETDTLTADSVVLRDMPQFLAGQIKSVDKKNYQFLMTSNGKDISYLFDVNPPTRTYTIGNGNKLAKSGFSQLEKGQTVYVFGFIGKTTKDGQTLLSTLRIIILKEPTTASSPTPTLTPKAK
ncbi:MAG: hypothetical protein M1120_01095 [Patescibacteria group bacterium]|nr:hypothetical protein [Patescibacteria group bacterium]